MFAPAGDTPNARAHWPVPDGIGSVDEKLALFERFE
jgi:hypothetical protein